MPNTLRPTKKQQELLIFISDFIVEHGYSPSYREIMVGCNYTSVATVALHINSLISRGHLIKRGRSARSLELTGEAIEQTRDIDITEQDSKWIINLIDDKFLKVESAAQPLQKQIDELYVLVGALKVLGLNEAANSFMPRLSAVRGLVAGKE